jgi:hypothetical protein
LKIRRIYTSSYPPYLNKSSPSDELLGWTPEELTEASTLLCWRHGAAFRLMTCIDRLDEFKGVSHTSTPLVPRIKTFVQRYKIKLCVFSRPWNVFSEAFNSHKHLMMDKLTRYDITHYVRTEFDRSSAFNGLKPLYPDETERLVKDIVDRANGVFLWVSLVVSAMLSLLLDGSSIWELTAALSALPDDLKRLYTTLWDSLPIER